MSWPDIVIAAILILSALRGFKTGFVRELTGAVALVLAIAAAFQYPGIWDGAIAGLTGLHPGSAHVLALILYAGAAYGIVLAIGAVLGRVAKLPVIGLGNALLGALLGVVKAAAFLWAVIYIALFFPLSRDLRHDLHASRLVALLQEPNASLDRSLRASLPWYVRPFGAGMFARHHV